MRDYNIQILGLSETRWNGFGEESADYGTTLLYSGKEDEGASKEYGVGLLLSRSAKNSLLDWKPISERIIVARFASRVRKVTVVQCYAPTNAAADETKSKFYDLLEATLKVRFTRAVAELQFLGFIKTSKRKTDHVMRLTW
ncbi:unnamed protein product [Plutella xylostella]|uniref:(diamondback moth) hypothetical protein n=1 Tax=Plutella xylostella TaxID=51655 RepID=A0A8S4FIB4_PLUXY|nr:unnamed protein product [Plutella xylostella]